MNVWEYRIPFPATIEEYRVGMLYMIARATAEEKSHNARNVAIEVIRNEIYTDNDHGLAPGIYTEKVFHIRNLLPRVLRPLMSDATSKVVEKAWAAYPSRGLTLYFWPFLGDRPVLSIESRYLSDRGNTENALGLSAEELNKRKIVFLDIASEERLRMSSDADVTNYASTQVAGRGNLQPGVWIRQADPIMCCYKVCRVPPMQPVIAQWGLRLIQNSLIHYNRQAFVWMDSWFGLSDKDVNGLDGTRIPERSAPKLQQQVQKARTIVATELATEAIDIACLAAFAHADATNPFA